MNTSFLRTYTTQTGEVVQGLALSESQLLLKFAKHLETVHNVEPEKARCLIYNGNAEKLALYGLTQEHAGSVATQVSANIPKEFNLNPIGTN